MNKDLIIQLLQESLKIFYQKDFYLLGRTHKVHEQAIAHRVAVYFEQQASSNPLFNHGTYSFDVEYNKNLQTSKEVFKNCLSSIKTSCNKRNCPCKEYSEQKESRPDFLVHQRGTNANNLLIVEFKTGTAQKEAHKYDLDKLTYFTCPKGEYKYMFGCFLFLEETKYEMRVFTRGEKQKILCKKIIGKNVK